MAVGSKQFGLVLVLGLAAGTASAQNKGITGVRIAPTRVHVVTEVKLKDGKRDRELPVKVYAPEPAGKYPVIIVSHRAGGSKDNFGPLSNYWASRGFVVIHPTHPDGRGQGAGFGAPLGSALNDPKTWENRARDVTFILNSLKEIERSSGVLKGKLDETRIGVAGNEFGAYTAMLAGGATVDFPDGTKDHGFADPRVKAVLVISGQGTGQLGLTERSWKKMALPMMTMTGSRDQLPGGKGPEWKKQSYEFSRPGDKYLAFIDGANGLSFGGELVGTGLAASALGPGVRAKLEGGRRVGFGPGGAAGELTEIFSAVKSTSLAFWNAYLKGESQYESLLKADKIATPTKGRVRISHR